MLESARVAKYPLEDDQELPVLDWEEYLHETASMILSEQSPKRLHETRVRLYELLTHCIPPEVILRSLVIELIKNVDDTIKGEIASLGGEYVRVLFEK